MKDLPKIPPRRPNELPGPHHDLPRVIQSPQIFPTELPKSPPQFHRAEKKTKGIAVG